MQVLLRECHHLDIIWISVLFSQVNEVCIDCVNFLLIFAFET